MKTASRALAIAAVLLAGGQAIADESLAKAKGCLACHAVDKKVLGPSFKEVAAKYKGDKTALDKLAAKVRAGGKGVWGEIPMPPNPVSEDEARKLVAWVLAQ
jgi:cytochrome c